jgi:hypothetical protein
VRTRIALLTTGATAAALAAPAVSAAPVHALPAVYRVSLTGSQRTVTTLGGTTTNDAGCTFRTANRDRRTISFASRRRMSLAIGSAGLPALRFRLVARVAGSFRRERSLVGGPATCPAPPAPRDTSCGPARLPARVLVSSKRNRIRLTGGFTRRGDHDRCATTLTRPDPFVLASESRLKRSPARARRVVVHGHLVEQTTVEHTTMTTIVDWTLIVARGS